ncbi:MAG: hypothetical protein RAK24_01345, partial [TACK group archaeon]|nr:hypothetical protein [TACK group archaeon]
MRVKNYAVNQLLHSKIGMLGIGIIVFFTVMAGAAPLIAMTPPNQEWVAGPWAVPQWATLLPQYRGLPPNLEAVPQELSSWSILTAKGTSELPAQVTGDGSAFSGT